MFVWVGVRSYGIYLWHWPVYMVTRPHADVPVTGIPFLVLRLALTFVLAALSYKYVEEPIRHGAIGRRFTAFRTSRGEPRRRIATGLVISGAAITLGVVVIAAGLLSAEPSAPPSELSEAAVLITPSPRWRRALPRPWLRSPRRASVRGRPSWPAASP